MPLDPQTADLMLTDFSAWENTLDDTQRQQLETTFKYEPDRVAAQKRFAAVASVAAYTNSDVQEVSNRFEDYYMHAFARDEQVGFGLKGGVKDINEFQQLLTERANGNKAKVGTFKSANAAAVDSALRGSSSLNDFAAWQLENEHLPEAFSDKAYEVWQKTYSDVENELGEDGRAAASRAFRAMRTMTGVSEESDASVNEAKRDLINLRVRSPKAYDLALASVQLMAQDAGGVDKGVIQGVGENFGRSISNIIEGAFFAKPLIEMSQDVSEAMVKAGITNAENPERLAAQIRARREVENDIREISRGIIDPVKKARDGWSGWAESAAYMTASSLPYMVGVFTPGGQGQVAMAGSFTSDSYNEFRNNGWEGVSAATGAVASGVFQSAVETASEFILKIPGVAGVLNKFGVKPGSFWATQFFLRTVARSGIEVGEEIIQEATTPFVQELANAIIPSIPDTPEGKHLSDVMGKFFEADNFAPLILSVLPLGMIGAGMSTSQDMDYLKEVQSFFGDDAASEIMAEADPAKRDAMIREKFKAMPVEELVKRARMKMEAMAKRTGQSFQNQQDVESFQDTTSPEYTVSVTRTPSGWQVRMGDGNVIQVDSVEAARRIAVDLRQVGSQQEADKLVGVIDGYYEKGRQAETVLTGEKVEASEEFGVVAIRRDASGAIISQRQLGPQALETVRAEAEVAGIKTGTRGVFAHINGSNEVFPMRVADGAKEIVRIMNLYQSQAEGQPQVITFLHENFESTWSLGMANGTFSDQETRTAMRALLPAFEGVTALNAEEAQFIDNLRTLASGKGNETMLRETVSEMVMRDVLGRDRQGLATGMKPGSISRAIEASVMGANTQEEASALKSILAAIKAFTAYLKGVFGTVDAITKARDEGKLGEEYDTFINKVLGIDEVKQMKQAAVEEGKAMLGVDSTIGNQAASNMEPISDAEALKTKEFSQAEIDAKEKIGEGSESEVFDDGDNVLKVAESYNQAETLAERVVYALRGEKLLGNLSGLRYAGFRRGRNGVLNPVFLQRKIEGPSATKEQVRELFAKYGWSENNDGSFSIDTPEGRVTTMRDLYEGGNVINVNGQAIPRDIGTTIDAKMAFSISPITSAEDVSYNEAIRVQPTSIMARAANRDSIGVKDNILYRKDRAYRFIGVEGLADLRESGLVRARQNTKQAYERAVFMSGKSSGRYADTHMIEVIPDDTWSGDKYISPSSDLAINDIPHRIYERNADGSYSVIEDTIGDQALLNEGGLEENGQKVDAGNMAFSIAPLRAFATKAEREYAFGDGRYTHPVTLTNGTRLSGETFDYKWGSKIEIGKAGGIPTFFGYTKNGDEITIQARDVRPDMVASSRDDNRSANDLRDRLMMWHNKAKEQGFDFLDAGNMAFSISPVTQEQDAEYLAAVESGDTAKAQVMVDEAADSIKAPWSGVIDLRDNYVESTFTKKKAASRDYHHTYLVNPSQLKRIEAGDADYFWLENGEPFSMRGLSPSASAAIKKQLTNKIKSADPVTRDKSGQVIPLSQRFNPETPDIRFSISPIRNLNELSDQVERNFAENPAGALEVKSKVIRQFAKLADKWSNERWTPQGNKIRPISEKRTVKSLDKEQAMRQATLEGEKIAANMEASQALKEAKAEAQAWRDEADAMQKEDWSPRESLVRDLITLEAIVAMFPQEIRGKIGGFITLARKASEAARLKVLQRQLERGQVLLEKHLKDQYGTAVDKLLERYQSKRDSSGRISGKILSTATEQVDYAAEFIDLDIASQAKEQAALEKQVEESESAEEVQDALTKLGIARLFEVWSTKDSASRESAFLWLNETIEQGKQGKKLLDEERKAFLDDMRQSGKSSILQGDELNPAIADNLTNLNKGVMRRALLGMRGVLSESLWTTLQRLELIFGEDSKILDYFAGKIINAANLSTDIKRLVEAQKRDALTVIFNSDSKFAHARGIAELQKLKDSEIMISKVTKKEIKLDIDTLTKLADGTMDAKTAGLEQAEVDAALEEFASNARKRTVTIEKVTSRAAPTSRTMSETQGIQWWLWSMQEASRKQMERDGWDADSFAQLEKFLSPEAKALGRWISGSYQDAAGMIDPIYRRLFNAPLPRIKNYSPIHRRNMNAGGEVMDLDSSDMNSGLAAGFTKSRVNTTASLVESDALAVFLAHWENVSHWVAHAEMMRDMKAILLDKDTAVAIRQKKSEGYLQRLKQDISTIEKNGTNSANELLNMSRFWRWLMQYRAYKGLAFRISPIIKQTPALLNPLLADVPAHNYMMGLSRAFIEPQAFASEVSAMWKSDIIRRRIESGFSAESRVAMQGTSMTGSQAILAMQTGMMPMQMVDGGWTALGAAISFDYYRRGYMRDNPQMTPEIADAKAIARVEKMIATSAQPSDVYARALYERSGNPFMRSMSMFVSDQRKALAVELMAIRKLATGKSKNKSLDVQRALVAHIVQAAVSQVMAGVIASLLGDDEDRDREWSTDQWTLALTLGPVNGLFVLGRLIDKVGRSLLGLRVFPSDDLASKTANDLLRGGKNMDELFSPDNSEEFIDALDSLSTAAAAGASAVIGPAAGAVDVGANVLREARKIQDRLSE